MKKYAIICLLIFHALQIEAQCSGVEITHILSSDSIDNGRPCKPYNLFPFYKNNRDSCLLCVCNKYTNNCKYYRYFSKENSVVLIDAIAKHHSDKYTDSLYSLTMLMAKRKLFVRNGLSRLAGSSFISPFIIQPSTLNVKKTIL